MNLHSAIGGPITAVVPVPDSGRIGEARRAAVALATGFDETAAGRIAIVATELATNLARHAKDGMLLLRRADVAAGTLDGPEAVTIEFVAVDRGPGMVDLSRSLRDGFSTSGTSGNGLGAVSRLADRFDIYSQPGKGTVVSCGVSSRSSDAREGATSQAGLSHQLTFGAICIPQSGESACGDGWATHQRPDGIATIMVVDGLGHGVHAAEAADAACTAFHTAMQRTTTPSEVVQLIHLALRVTRGAAVAIAEIDTVRRTVHFTGIGNIAAMIVAARSQSLVSLNGIAGHQVGQIREFAYAWPTGATLVLSSDGLTTRWTADAYPGSLSRHPSVLAALLHRDYSRGRDDATVVAIREVVDIPAVPFMTNSFGGAVS